MAPVTSKFLLTNTWCGQRILIMWTAYEPSLNFNTPLTVPPGYLTSAAAVVLSAASPVMIVPVPGRQFSGTLTFDSLIRARLCRLLCAKHARDGTKADDRERS
jgi:hypothetical protein